MDRRQFLQLGGTAAAVALSGTSLWSNSASKPQYGVWLGHYDTLEEWKRNLERMRKAGITMIIPNTPHEKLDALAQIVPLAKNEGLDVHVWRVCMLNANPLKDHPEWYGVSRSGKSTATNPPYVDYYRFMCPNREEVQQFLRGQITALAQVPDIKSVHLDYIRFPDVILPVGLWEKYHLVQDKEYPDFDFCYCNVCREKFRAQSGIDPLKLGDDAPANEAWVKFRWNSITNIVGGFYDIAHANGKKLTAAVFPTPDIAHKLVRQDWVNWKTDELMPMMYNGFYKEPVTWVADATKQGVSALHGSNNQLGAKLLHSGVYIPDLTPDEMETATKLALANGASGVVYFDARALTDAHWTRLARITA